MLGGGRLRLLGLYHALGPRVKTLYVGTYDWPGPGYRRQMLSSSLEELLIPLSAEHFAEARARSSAVGDRVLRTLASPVDDAVPANRPITVKDVQHCPLA